MSEVHEEEKYIHRSVEHSQSGTSVISRIVVPDFSKAALQNGRRDVQEVLLFGSFFFDFKVTIYSNGCSSENNGYLSIMFRALRTHYKGFMGIVSVFTCIVSIVDNYGSERFTQSVVKECEKYEDEPFGFQRFVKCSLLWDNPDEFISNGQLTISCVGFYDDNGYKMEILIKIPNLPVNLSECCQSDVKCNPYEMKECCQSIIEEPGTFDSKLVFRGQLFEFLKKESKFFQRIQKVNMKERSADSMEISRTEVTIFLCIQEAVVFTGYLTVPPPMDGDLTNLTQMEVFCDLYEFADRYEILSVLKACSHYLMDSLSANNAVQILILSDLHSDLPLKSAAINYIASCWSEVDNIVTMEVDDWEILNKERKDLAAEIIQQGAAKKM